MNAPIALFAYRRPDHLRGCVAALRANPEAARSALHVFCDGPKGAADAAGVAEVRQVVAAIEGFAEVHVHMREENAGLARSIIEGVTDVVNRHGQVIVVEDDLVVAPHFLRYMNDALALYANDESVASIHGYIYPIRTELPPTFFLRGADCWGWATWSRAWRMFEPDGARLLSMLTERGLLGAFDRDGAYPFAQMLRDQVAGAVDSWAIRWHASAFLRDALTLYPGHSLVQNCGNDGSGTHGGSVNPYAVELATAAIRVERIPLEEHAAAAQAVTHYFRGTFAANPKRMGWWQRVFRRAKNRLKGTAHA